MVVAVTTGITPVAPTTVEFRIGGQFFRASLCVDFIPYGAVAIVGGVDELVFGTIERTMHIDTPVGHLP